MLSGPRIIATLAVLCLPLVAADRGPYEVTIKRGVKAEMRDGVTLVADIYRPDADGKFPVMLCRSFRET